MFLFTAQAAALLTTVTPQAIEAVFSDIDPRGPGCALGVADHGRTLLRQDFGMASIEHRVPISPQTVFDAASVSKQFTAFAVLLLAAEGRLSLNDDVRRWLPELPHYGARITIAHLLQHTSGLRDYGDLFALAGSEAADPVSAEEAVAMIFRQRALNFTPGSQRQYSNSGYLLLARIVQAASGQPLKDFAAARIFRPLGMNNTSFLDDHTIPVLGRAWGYRPDGEGGWRFSLPVSDVYGPSNLFTTVDDLLIWQRHFGQPRADAAALLAAMQQRGRLSDGTPFNYGYGLDVIESGGLLHVGHSGGNEGFNTMTLRFPSRDLSVVVLCNRTEGDAPGRAQRVADLYLGTAPQAPPAGAPAVPIDPAQLAQFAGTWANPLTNDVRRTAVRDGELVYLRGAMPVLVPVGPGRFRFPTAPVTIMFHVQGARREMHVSQEGQPTAVYQAMPPFAPSAAVLADYAGTYWSDEIETRYEITTRPGGLALRAKLAEPFDLVPVYPDAFLAGDFLARFTRGPDGRIDGMLVDQVRVRDLRFSRVRP